MFFARFFLGLRVFGALVARVSRMRFGTFLFYDALGGVVWATAAVSSGGWARRASYSPPLAVLAVVLYLLYRWAANHPERLRSAFERLGGERIRRFLESSAGLWLRRRFAPREAYGVALTAGLANMGLFFSSWPFGAIAEDLLSPDPLVRVEVQRFGEKDYGVALGAAYEAHRLWGERQEPQRDYRKELEAAWLDKELGAEEAELLRASAKAT